MNIKSCILAAGVMAAMILCDANLAEAHGFGFRGGAAMNLGVGGERNRTVRYYGPGFYAAPQTYGANRQSATHYQQRPWNYYRSGPFEYYRPVNPLYQTR